MELDVTQLANLVPEVALVIIFMWFSHRSNEGHLKALQSQADMFVGLMSKMEAGERAERENERQERHQEAEAFRASLRYATDSFAKTIETMAEKWGREIEELTLEVKTLTRFMVYLAGRLGGPTFEEVEKEEQKEKKPRH